VLATVKKGQEQVSARDSPANAKAQAVRHEGTDKQAQAGSRIELGVTYIDLREPLPPNQGYGKHGGYARQVVRPEDRSGLPDLVSAHRRG
jgi:hypothetical protein